MTANDKTAGWLEIALAAKLRAANNAANPIVKRAYSDEAGEIQAEILHLRSQHPTPLEEAIGKNKK